MPSEKLKATRQTYLRYLKLSVLTHGQAASLFAGLNPEFLLEIILADKPKHQGWIDDLREFSEGTKVSKSGAAPSELLEAKEKIEGLRPHIALQFPGRAVPNPRSTTGRSLDDAVVSPVELMRWANEIELELPEELQSASVKLFSHSNPVAGHSDDLKAKLEALKAENAELTRQIARLEKKVTQLKNDEIQPKTKISLQKMLLAMAVTKYRWNPKVQRQHVARSIEGHALGLGIQISSKTINQHLEEASNAISWENTN